MAALGKQVGGRALSYLRYGTTGHRIYGYALLPDTNPEYPFQHADVVLERRTTEEDLGSFIECVANQPRVDVGAIPRLGDEGPMESGLFHAT